MLYRQLLSPFRRRFGGWSTAIIALEVTYTAAQFVFKFKLPSTKTVTLHWGDGTSEDVVGQDAVEISKTSSYSGADTYKFWVSGDDTDITYIKLDNDIDNSCDMTKWSALTSLTHLTIEDTMTLSGALPSSLTSLYLNGAGINWTYNGALPTGITYLYLIGININWTYNGVLPTGLTSLRLYGAGINWTYNGALPTGLTSLYLIGDNINWTYNGALPTGLTYLRLNGAGINWTGLDIGDTGNITYLDLSNYRDAKMSSADMITLLTQMENRTGSLPATVTINDYADYAAPPAGVTDAVDSLKTAKGITTVTLGA